MEIRQKMCIYITQDENIPWSTHTKAVDSYFLEGDVPFFLAFLTFRSWNMDVIRKRDGKDTEPNSKAKEKIKPCGSSCAEN